MARTSRFPGFYKVTVQERRALVAEIFEDHRQRPRVQHWGRADKRHTGSVDERGQTWLRGQSRGHGGPRAGLWESSAGVRHAGEDGRAGEAWHTGGARSVSRAVHASRGRSSAG